METDLLLAGAEKLAAANTLGLSTDEALILLRREARRYERQNPGSNFVEDLQAAEAAANQVAPSEIRNYRTLDSNYLAEGFGDNQDSLQQLIPADRNYGKEGQTEARAAAQRAREDERPPSRPGQREFETPLRSMDPNAIELGDVRHMVGVEGVRDALLRVENAARVAGGLGNVSGAAAILGSLEDALEPGRIQSEADESLGRETVRRDNARLSGGNEVEQANIYRAAAEANAIARERFQRGGLGAQADEVINRMPFIRIRNDKYPYTPSNREDVATREGVYVDPRTGNPVAMDEPATNAISGSNTPDTAQALNAPKSGSAIDWVAENRPENMDFGSSGGNYPQVDITGETTLFADRLRALGGPFANVSPNIRSVSELQKVIDRVIADGEASGRKWMQSEVIENPDGSKVFRKKRLEGAPGADQVMEVLNYTPAEKARFANAMIQLEGARIRGADDPIKQAYFARKPGGANTEGIVFNAPTALANPDPGDTDTPLAVIRRNQKISEGGKRVPIRSALARLDDQDAGNPVIGQIQGEPPRINRRNIPGVSGEDVEPAMRAKFEGFAQKSKKPVDERKLKESVIKARLVEERHNKFLQEQAAAAEIERRGMEQAQSDFQKMVNLEKASPRRTRTPGRPF